MGMVIGHKKEDLFSEVLFLYSYVNYSVGGVSALITLLSPFLRCIFIPCLSPLPRSILCIIKGTGRLLDLLQWLVIELNVLPRMNNDERRMAATAMITPILWLGFPFLSPTQTRKVADKISDMIRSPTSLCPNPILPPLFECGGYYTHGFMNEKGECDPWCTGCKSW